MVAPALVVRRGAEATRRCPLQLDAVEVAVERQVEVEPRLLAVGDHVEAGADLVVDGGDDGVVLQLGAIGRAEAVEVLDGEQQPAGQRVAADDRRPQLSRHCADIMPSPRQAAESSGTVGRGAN